MRHARLLMAATLFPYALTGCGTDTDMTMMDEMEACGAALAGKADSPKADANAMPLDIVKWQRQNMWGKMHIHFHVGRRWDIMNAQGISWAKSQGIKRAALQ